MAKKSRIERRGAVYYWRRRIPLRIADCVGRSHIRLCLRTKEPAEARFLAHQLDATAEEMFMTIPGTITNEQLKTLFASAFQQHQDKLRLLADVRLADGLYSPEEDARESRILGWAYRHLSRFGGRKPLDAEARTCLLKDGARNDEIEHIGAQIDRMRQEGLATGSVNRLRRLLEQNMVQANAINISAAKGPYLRALGDALLHFSNTAESDRLPFDEIIEQLRPEKTGTVPHTDDVSEAAPGKTDLDAPADSEVEMTADQLARTLEIGEKLVGRKLKANDWDIKTVRQARSIFDLFSRFLSEKIGTDDLCRLRQETLYAFDDFLHALKKSYGKSQKDKEKSIALLLQESAALPKERRGLDIATRNRHYTNLGLLLREAKKAGYQLSSEIDLSDFRGRSRKTARGARPKPKADQLEPIFRSSIFVGCKDWQHPERPGTEVYHGALYFGTLLGVYQGARREEFCGLLVDDVIRDNGPHPYLHVTFTEQRRVKNEQSIRNLALHPEVIRLGFLDYVDAISALGYRRLFPDLYSPSTQSPMGDRFYDELKPVLSAVGVTPHQLRHFFNNALKKARTAEEERADLLGHLRGSETADRYCDPIDLEIQLDVITRLPVLTGHLEPRPIRLIPWVERREIAPWSRAAKQARKVARTDTGTGSEAPHRNRMGG